MNRSPMKGIRAFCLECCGGSSNEVKLCVSKNCALYPFRFGKNPNIKLTDEQKAQKAEILKKARLAQGKHD